MRGRKQTGNVPKTLEAPRLNDVKAESGKDRANRNCAVKADGIDKEGRFFFG